MGTIETEFRFPKAELTKMEDKEDRGVCRLSIAKEKKKRYGLKRLSKEENMRLKKRT